MNHIHHFLASDMAEPILLAICAPLSIGLIWLVAKIREEIGWLRYRLNRNPNKDDGPLPLAVGEACWKNTPRWVNRNGVLRPQ